MEHITKVKDLYERTVTMISESEENWREFLECMGRLYQLDYLNTCMVYAQRPDATVLAGFDEWMELNLPVMRGSRGIAIFPSKLFGENVTHVFDVSDTKGPGVRPWNWTVNGTNRRKLAKMLFPEIYEKEKKFKNSLNTFTRTYVLFMIREEDGISKTLQRLKVLTGAEAELEEMEITRFIVDSALYAVESRCGVTDGELDFSLISRYQNEEILYRAGRLVSHLSGKVLFEISKTMKTIDLERSAYYGRDYRNSVQGSGRHSISRVGGNYERGNGNGNTGQVRQDGSQRPAGERSGPVRDDASVGNASSENAGSTGAGGNAARRDRGETGTGMDGTGQRESIRYHENDGPADTGRDGSRGRSDQGSHSSDEITKTQQPEDMPQEKPKQEEQKQEDEKKGQTLPINCIINNKITISEELCDESDFKQLKMIMQEVLKIPVEKRKLLFERSILHPEFNIDRENFGKLMMAIEKEWKISLKKEEINLLSIRDITTIYDLLKRTEINEDFKK